MHTCHSSRYEVYSVHVDLGTKDCNRTSILLEVAIRVRNPTAVWISGQRLTIVSDLDQRHCKFSSTFFCIAPINIRINLIHTKKVACKKQHQFVLRHCLSEIPTVTSLEMQRAVLRSFSRIHLNYTTTEPRSTYILELVPLRPRWPAFDARHPNLCHTSAQDKKSEEGRRDMPSCRNSECLLQQLSVGTRHTLQEESLCLHLYTNNSCQRLKKSDPLPLLPLEEKCPRSQYRSYPPLISNKSKFLLECSSNTNAIQLLT